METRAQKLSHCRYYTGDGNNPHSDGDMAWFWDMERVYVENKGEFVGETEYYKNIKGKAYPGIAFELLMVMFTSWGKSAYDLESSIDRFYKLVDKYLFIPNDHFTEDEIPNG